MNTKDVAQITGLAESTVRRYGVEYNLGIIPHGNLDGAGRPARIWTEKDVEFLKNRQDGRRTRWSGRRKGV